MTTEEKLAEAEQAYHDFVTGQHVVRCTVNGRVVEFSQSNIDVLRRYISDLKAQVGRSNRRGPAGVSL